MKKTETTHLKVSQVGGGSVAGQRGESSEVREFKRVSLRELKASEKAEMGRRCGSAANQRHGSEAWIGGLGFGSAWEFDEVGQLVGR